MATSARLDELKKKFDENPRRYFAPLANEYRKLGDLTQAIALCRTHLPNQPGHISGHIVLAQALYEARELGEARSIFEASLELDPENLIALRYLGDIAREQGEPSMARTWYERVLEADPRNDEIAQLLQELATAESAAVSVVESVPEPVAPTEPAETLVSEVPQFLADATELPAAEVDQPADLALPFHSNEMDGAYDAIPALAGSEALPLAHAIPALADLTAELPAEDSAEIQAEASAAADVSHEAAVPEPVASSTSVSDVDDPFFGGSAPHNEIDLGELEAVAEPTVDDWFSAPSDASAHDVAAHAASAPAAFDDSFFPDLAAATPIATPIVPEPATLSFAPPVEVDVQAPTPPYVRAEDERAPIATPAFLAAIDDIDLSEGSIAPAAAVTSEAEPVREIEMSVGAGEPVDAAATQEEASSEAPAFVSAYEVEHATDATPAAPVEASGPVVVHESAEIVDWHTAPTPIDSPAIPELAIETTTLATVAEAEADAVADASVEAPVEAFAETLAEAPAMVDPSLVEASSEFSDFNAWIADAASEPASAPVASAEQSIDEVVASVDSSEPAEGVITEFETEDDYAALATEASAAATPADFVLEEDTFVPPAADEVTYIASSISAPLDAVDAYSAGAPELSAHEPFQLEGERERDLDSFEPALGGWGNSPFDAAAPSEGSLDVSESREDVVAPVEGLLSRETPADLAAVSALHESETANADADARPVLASMDDDVVDVGAITVAAETSTDVAAGESPAFVTETMAELYLQQGFHDEALSIYRQLLAQQPNDPALRDRVAALERGASSAVVEGLAPRDVIDRHGQSVRSFFLHFARREPRRAAASQGEEEGESSDPAGARHSAADPDQSEPRIPSFAGVATREEALTVPDVPESMPRQATSLSDLFAAGSVSGADDRAASALASAFGSGDAGTSAPATGSGERELSLEHLFRDVPERSSGAVTLDEFYEGSSPGSSAPPSPAGEGGEERDADIEQFTAWLEGLKKK